MKYVAPDPDLEAFNCPHCHAYSQQTGGELVLSREHRESIYFEDHWVTCCAHCRSPTVWLSGALVYPDSVIGELPNDDLPDGIKADYEEARSIAAKSPRGAAALLRLAAHKLCKEVGYTERDLSVAIASFVKDGASQLVQKSLDTVRLFGNDAVHAGELDVRDNRETVVTLLKLVNFIAYETISKVRIVNGIYNTLPPAKRDVIDERDKSKS